MDTPIYLFNGQFSLKFFKMLQKEKKNIRNQPYIR